MINQRSQDLFIEEVTYINLMEAEVVSTSGSEFSGINLSILLTDATHFLPLKLSAPSHERLNVHIINRSTNGI